MAQRDLCRTSLAVRFNRFGCLCVKLVAGRPTRLDLQPFSLAPGNDLCDHKRAKISISPAAEMAQSRFFWLSFQLSWAALLDFAASVAAVNLTLALVGLKAPAPCLVYKSCVSYINMDACCVCVCLCRPTPSSGFLLHAYIQLYMRLHLYLLSAVWSSPSPFSLPRLPLITI
jgi:hypothetical protein